MDYDDNDFQGQNLRLAGEGSSKFSPALCPYALPKFDFDDGLQAHLRFDSLVENEVFLGIPSQEDNHWIEDFSRGSSGIEFSSSAAESCSRRNNVWSEATSSESVEMLLKSVGQEEMVLRETIMEESDACDDSGGLTEQMEHHLKQDDKTKVVMDSKPALPSNEFLEHYSRLNDVKCTSQIQEAEISNHGSSHELDPNVSSETCDIIVSENMPGGDRKCDVANQTDVDVFVNEFTNNKMQKDSSGSGMQIDIGSSSQDIASSVQVLNTQESEHPVSEIGFENANHLLIDTSKAAEELTVLREETDADDQILKGIVVKTGSHNLENLPCSSVEVESTEHVVESGIINFEEPSSFPSKRVAGNAQVAEGGSENLRSPDPGKASECELVDLSNSTEICCQFRGNLHGNVPVVFETDSNCEGHSIEVSNIKAGTCASSELKIDQTTFGDDSSVEGKAHLLGSGHQLYAEASVSKSESSLISGVDNKVFDGQGDGSSSSYVKDQILTIECPSNKLLGKNHTIESLSGVDGVHKEDSNTDDHASYPVVAALLQTYEVNLVSNPNDVHYSQDVSFKEKEDAKLPNDTSNRDNEIVRSPSSVKRVEPLILGEDIKINNEVVHQTECLTTTRNEPALNVSFEKTTMTLHDPVDGVPLLSKISGTVDQGTDRVDDTIKMDDGGLKEANLLSLEASSRGASVLGPLLELEKGPSHGSSYVDQSLPTVETCNSASGTEQSVELPHKTVDQSLPVPEISNADGRSEQAVKANEISRHTSNKSEASLNFRDSAVKEGNSGVGLLFPQNCEEVALEKNHEEASSKVADVMLVANKGEVLPEPTVITLSESRGNMGQNDRASGDTNCGKNAPNSEGGSGSTDSAKPYCGTPTFSSIVVSRSEMEKEVKDSLGEIVPLSVVNVQSTSDNVTRDTSARGERGFTFGVHPSAGLSERVASKDVQSITTIKTNKIPMIVKGSPSTPIVGQTDPKTVLDVSRGNSRAPDGEIACGGSKGTPELKTRRASGRRTGKESAKRGNHMKETTPVRQSERSDKSCSVSVSLTGTGQFVQFEGLRSFGNVERSGTIPSGVVSTPISNLPDLNTSVPPSALFQQPFTDLQQVQLRAQIFVYGSLIQGAAPDEACMVSAFGASDGGRSVWEPFWRACVERNQRQKSHPNKSETPVQPRSESRNAGGRLPDQSIKRGAHQSKVASSALGQPSSKGTPSPVANSMIPLSSPVWNMSTPYDGLQSNGMARTGLLDYHQTPPSLHPFQTPPLRGFVGHNASWLAQTPFSGPWVASPQTSAFDANARFSVLPMTETVKLTPVKESSAPVASGRKHASPCTLVHSTGPSVLPDTSSQSGMKNMAVFPCQNSTDLKARKRKKDTVSVDLGRISLLAQTRSESISAPVVTSHFSTSVVVSTPAFFASKTDANKIVTAVSPTSSTDCPKRGEQNAEQKVTLSEETFGKVEEAKRQAEDAAALAASAVSYCQSVWSQLDKQKNSGLIPDVEAKLSSAAVAVAAAASVSKAAAAAAKIASNVALQAKLMADEALISSGTNNPTQSNASSSLSGVNKLGCNTTASILMGGNGSSCSSSIIGAAREAARRRVEAASSASKQAENLDAILKAAELAAEAVSQAGRIVAMGDPLPLNALVEAGPEGYWRTSQVPLELGLTSNNNNRERSKVDRIEDGFNVSGRHAKDGQPEEAKTKNYGLLPLSREVSRESVEDHPKAVDGVSSSFTTSETNSKVKRSRRASDLAKTIGVVPESEIGLRSASITSQDEYENRLGSLKENGIKEGCLVEIRKDGGKFKTAWFSAHVLSLKDGKAFVCYTELQSDEGSGQLREWVALEGEANDAPRVRIAHPMTTMRLEGTRKRRRAAMGDYVWSVGDRVDIWMQECWREGVVTEKNKTDDTTLTVHFPAERETSIVKAWHLRPALIWKDGEWIEWSSSKEKDPSSQGDAPQEKRLKLGKDGTKNEKVSKNIEFVGSGKPDESRLPLSASEKIFNVGKSIGDQKKPNTLRTIRTGLQKEGSRVVFGIPKPGKKRKFMEVSKHYVAERSSKTNESNVSVEFAKYLMPRGSGSRGWKNTKIVANEKQAAESKTKVLKSGKSQSVSGRTLPQKDKVLISAQSAQIDVSAMDGMVKDSVSADENVSGQQNLTGFGSFSKTAGVAEGPVLFSSLALPSDVPSKKMFTSNAKSERVDGGKLAPSSRKLAKVDVKDKFTNDDPEKSILKVVEPRRSNRRIQPTSRLLEGLQSSLIISKIPAVSHDKSHRSQSRGTSKGNNHG
ncbi:hypothetical protein U1Q18_021408 [Sarracenia purpurea var. burkii]